MSRSVFLLFVSLIAAAVPPALAVGPGAETRIPMAIAVIGGVTFSTILTLFVVPCAYSLFSAIERKRYGAPPSDPGVSSAVATWPLSHLQHLRQST